MDQCSLLTWIVFWTVVLTVNVRGLCNTPMIPHGWSEIRMRGRIVYYFCDKGYQLYGNRTAKCIHNKWNLPTPTCVAPGCDANVSVASGVISTVYNGSVLSVSCINDTILRGRKHVFCDGRTWSTAPPQCLAPEDITFCDFENEGMCGWEQDNHDDFDWKLWSGETPTARTGPRTDHTYGGQSRAGHYIYMEASAPRQLNHTTRLLSPRYPADKTGRCFRVWLHMLGPSSVNDVGTLNIKLKDGVDPFSTLSVLLSVSGNQGPRWKSVDVYIPKTDRPYQLQLEAVRQRSYVSDIAVDDLGFYDCVPSTTSTTGETTTMSKFIQTTTGDSRTTSDNKENSLLRNPLNLLQMSPLDVDGSGEESHVTILPDSTKGDNIGDSVSVTQETPTTDAYNIVNNTDTNISNSSGYQNADTTDATEITSFKLPLTTTDSTTLSNSQSVVITTDFQKPTSQSYIQHSHKSKMDGTLEPSTKKTSKTVTVLKTYLYTSEPPSLSTAKRGTVYNKTKEYLDVVHVNVEDGIQIVTLCVSVVVVTVFISILMLFIVLCRRRQRRYEEKYTEMKRFVETHYRNRYV